MSEPLLAVEHVAVRAGGRAIVRGVSFTALAGEITAVIGPNGAGKTSLLEAIVGLRAADGVVRVSGKPLSSFGARARAFAYLPDQGEPPGEATVRTLVEHAVACGHGKTESAGLQRQLAIDPLLDRGAGGLSRGERQRLTLFSTLVLGRPVVVLDEPFSAFDPLQLRDVLRAVRANAAAGAAIIASIHQLADAEKVADRVLLLVEGSALAFGTPSELKAEAGGADMTLEEAFVTLLSRSAREA